ncbi:MAG: SLBB domain-containing protein [Nitrospiraceae bacterium]|nr:SLBB domain-containing protein [Nitrospiraceae bacterium]
MFKRIVCFLLIFLFSVNAFAVEVETIQPSGGGQPVAQAGQTEGLAPLMPQLLQMQRQLQQIQLELQNQSKLQGQQLPSGGQTDKFPGQSQLNQSRLNQGNLLPFGGIGNSSSAGQNGIENAAGQYSLKNAPAHEKLSEIEQFFAGHGMQNAATLRQFGYDLFNKQVTSFAPGDEIPVPLDYVIGPADEIRIDMWGKVSGNWVLTVDKDGNINIPQIGTVGVTGLTFNELKSVLRKKFSEYYKGFEMNVSMGSLKGIRVYIVGNAKNPGAYTVSSLSTMVNALFECGGPSKNGSMRSIQLKRDGKTITTLDMYDFLLNGDKSNDVRLLSGDVIFIPSIGPVAAVEGNVERPAIYELKSKTKISDLLAMAGGITPGGYLNDVQLERVHDHTVKTMLDTNFTDLNQKTDVSLRDGDILKVLGINNKLNNAVTLEGNVVRPGQYQWFKGMRVSDLIKDSANDLQKDSDFDVAVIERYIPPDYHNEFLSFNLGKALFDKDQKENKLLEPYDVVHIYSKWDFKKKPLVRIEGAVNEPGAFEFTPGMKVSDLLDLAGGLKRYAFMGKAELTRINITNAGPETVRIPVDLKKALAGGPANDITLKEDDYLFVRSVPDWQLYRIVTVSGEVRFPGKYAIRRDETLSSLLERAGGYTKDAYLQGSVFTRKSVQKMQQQSLNDMVQRLQTEIYAGQSTKMSNTISSDEVNAQKNQMAAESQFLQSLKQLKATGRMVIVLSSLKTLKGSMYDIELQDGDSLYIPSQNSVVNVVGSVMSGTTSLVYSKDLDGKDYIKLAGGYSEYADKDHVYVLKADGSASKLSGSSIRWSPLRHRWETGSDAVNITPGDTIVVPEKLQQVSWLQGVRDITQIMMQIAVTAGVVIKLF